MIKTYRIKNIYIYIFIYIESYIHPTLDCAVPVDDAFGVGVARVG